MKHKSDWLIFPSRLKRQGRASFVVNFDSVMAYKKILKALYDYEAAAEDELNFSEGDLLGVVIGNDETNDDGDDGWYYGCNVMNQSEVNGLIPKTYCEEVI